MYICPFQIYTRREGDWNKGVFSNMQFPISEIITYASWLVFHAAVKDSNRFVGPFFLLLCSNVFQPKILGRIEFFSTMGPNQNTFDFWMGKISLWKYQSSLVSVPCSNLARFGFLFHFEVTYVQSRRSVISTIACDGFPWWKNLSDFDTLASKARPTLQTN